jgi:formylglycine-generating enzyme required for sulfatase activity
MARPLAATLSIIALLGTGSANAATKCAPDAVRVGPLCVDTYEASVWGIPHGNDALIKKTQKGKATLTDLLDAGSTQYGCSDAPFSLADYPASFPLDGNATAPLYAVSLPGVMPSSCLSWFQAQQACKNAGKRLLTNAEWQMAAAGTPDPGAAGNGITACNTATAGPVFTGGASECRSLDGVRDMAGNVHEWVGDWIPKATQCQGWGPYSDDFMCVGGEERDPLWGIGAVYRGGSWSNGTGSGILAFYAWFIPQATSPELGFRCAR